MENTNSEIVARHMSTLQAECERNNPDFICNYDLEEWLFRDWLLNARRTVIETALDKARIRNVTVDRTPSERVTVRYTGNDGIAVALVPDRFGTTADSAKVAMTALYRVLQPSSGQPPQSWKRLASRLKAAGLVA